VNYQPMRAARWLLVALLVALWLAALGCNADRWLVRTCVEVRVDGPTLSWTTPLTCGTAPLHDVLRIGGSRMSRQLPVIELRDRRPLIVPVRYGFGALERAISAGAPGVTVEER
jgi:hypothetical protein